jgi:hypothetical protein
MAKTVEQYSAAGRDKGNGTVKIGDVLLLKQVKFI